MMIPLALWMMVVWMMVDVNTPRQDQCFMAQMTKAESHKATIMGPVEWVGERRREERGWTQVGGQVVFVVL